MPLFEVAIIQEPTKKEVEEGTGVEVLLFGPKAVLAANPQAAGIVAVTGPEAPKDLNMARAKVLIRPFV